MQDLPPAADLLDAIADLLAERVLPEVADPALRHEVRVAASLCRILARESASDDGLDDRQRRALAEVMGEEGTTAHLEGRLAELLASGRPVDGATIAALRELVAAKLEVARPGYTS